MKPKARARRVPGARAGIPRPKDDKRWAVTRGAFLAPLLPRKPHGLHLGPAKWVEGRGPVRPGEENA